MCSGNDQKWFVIMHLLFACTLYLLNTLCYLRHSVSHFASSNSGIILCVYNFHHKIVKIEALRKRQICKLLQINCNFTPRMWSTFGIEVPWRKTFSTSNKAVRNRCMVICEFPKKRKVSDMPHCSNFQSFHMILQIFPMHSTIKLSK